MNSNRLNPTFEGVNFTARNLTAKAVNDSGNSIAPAEKVVRVTGVATDANDWVTLPNIESVPLGHTLTILASASSNFELRTPTASNSTINNVDSDGTQEYLVTDTDIVTITKRTATGWIAQSATFLGATRTAVIPD